MCILRAWASTQGLGVLDRVPSRSPIGPKSMHRGGGTRFKSSYQRCFIFDVFLRAVFVTIFMSILNGFCIKNLVVQSSFVVVWIFAHLHSLCSVLHVFDSCGPKILSALFAAAV